MQMHSFNDNMVHHNGVYCAYALVTCVLDDIVYGGQIFYDNGVKND